MYLEAVRLPAAELLVEGLHATDAPRSREVPNAAINHQQPSIAAPSPREFLWWNSECDVYIDGLDGAGGVFFVAPPDLPDAAAPPTSNWLHVTDTWHKRRVQYKARFVGGLREWSGSVPTPK